MKTKQQICEQNTGTFPPITLQQYEHSVETLLGLARTDSGGASPAAQVLLSLYNGDLWKADLAHICCSLDSSYFDHAVISMLARAQLMREPHDVIHNGNQQFEELGRLWHHLREPQA